MNRSPKLSSFEGFRGIAALVVVVWHLRYAFYSHTLPDDGPQSLIMPDSPAAFLAALCGGLTDGTFAVWLFWIMSGFVLSLQFFLRARYETADAAHDYLEDACLRRYPRLFLPVIASVCLAYLLMQSGLMSNHRLAEHLGESRGSQWLGRMYAFSPSLAGAAKDAAWNGFFNFKLPASYNSVLWTMEKEFYGSLFLFAFLALVGRRSSRFLAYAAAFLVNQRLDLNSLNAFVGGIALCDAFVNSQTMRPLAGLLERPGIAGLRESRWLAVACWLALILGVGVGLTYLFLGLAAVALTLLSTPTQALLSRRLPMFLGRISFGLYLVHTPIICSFSATAFLALVGTMGHPAAAFLVSGATCLLSLALGYLFTIAVDVPAIRLSRMVADFMRNTPRWLATRPVWAGVGCFGIQEAATLRPPIDAAGATR